MAAENNKDGEPKNSSPEASASKSIRNNNPTSQGMKHMPSSATAAMPHHRIPRPPNAFMIFANEHRKLLAKKHPRESNKEISIRLGKMWRSLTDEIKTKYHSQAKLMDLEHKKKYPDYVYNPRDARLRKEARRQRLLAGQHLARAMSHHIMVKQAKNTIIHQRMGMQLSQPIAVTYANTPASVQQQQINNAARRVAIREQVLRGLGFQSSPLPSFQTLLPTRPLSTMHLLAPGNPGPNATVTSMPNGTMDPNMATYVRTSQAMTQQQHHQEQGTGSQQHLQQVVQQQTDADGMMTVQQSVDLASMAEEQADVMEVTRSSTVQKNPLLTLANEAVSQLTEKYPNSRFSGKPSGEECGEGDPEVTLQTAVEGLEATADMDEMQASACSSAGACPGSDIAGEGENMKAEVVMGMSQVDEDQKMEDKYLSKQQVASPSWIGKGDQAARRPIPMYLVHPPTPPLMAMRSPVAACVPYPFSNANCAPVTHYQTPIKGYAEIPVGSRRLSDPSTELGTTLPTTSSTVVNQASPSAYAGMLSRPKHGLTPVQWGSPLEPPLIPANNMYAAPAIPTYQNNIGGVMPWASGRVFYVPMQEVTPLGYNAPAYTYQPNGIPYSTVSFEQCYPKAMGDKMMVAADGLLAKDAEALVVATAASSPDKMAMEEMHPGVQVEDDDDEYVTGAGDDDGGVQYATVGAEDGSKVFGQILSSTMQILNEEDEEQEETKPLKPTCHVNYELVEQDSSPNRKLAELSPAEPTAEVLGEVPNSQFNVVYY